MAKQTLFHGRPAGNAFEPQIRTYLTPDEVAAEAYAALEGEDCVLYVIELDLTKLSVEFTGGRGSEERQHDGLDVAIIQTTLGDHEHAAFVLLTEAAVRAVRVVDTQEFSGGDYWFCVLSSLDGCKGMYMYEEDAEPEPGDEVVPVTECPEHGRDGD